MGNQDGIDKRALDDCHDTLDELRQENHELKEENEELREASTVFGDLAERLSKELRGESEDVDGDTTRDADPDGVL
jgi:predicted nuclease with TOPRIM domain